MKNTIREKQNLFDSKNRKNEGEKEKKTEWNEKYKNHKIFCRFIPKSHVNDTENRNKNKKNLYYYLELKLFLTFFY